ncbi:MAG: LUD domain-containing protein [Halobacteriales archaeon]|nr:LUD domain-containing protein [Halobacteriales archaeon]
MSRKRKRKAEDLRRIMEEDGEAIGDTTRLATQLTEARLAMTPDYEELRDEARSVKEEAIENLPELIEETKRAVEENGGNVYIADDAGDANDYIREVAREEDAESVVKSKSMTTEEIEVNDALAEDGVDAWETDLGEYVIQVAGDKPSHLIGPAMHLSAEDIAEIFNREFDTDEELSANPIELTAFARDRVGEKIENADIGMTGANFVVAESGSILLVTNEGNARKTAVTPDTHIAVAGVEKIVPSVSDLDPFVELIAKTGTGQDITSYVSLLTPPVDTPTVDFDADELGGNERDFHLVLLDNGRMEMRDDPDLRETLYCIRCGACANTCANFQSVGGHAFGGETYTGGIGTGWEAGIHGLDSAGEFNDLCTGCSRCLENCPVKIDIPWINTVVRDRVNREGDGKFGFLVDGLSPDAEDGADLQKRFFGNVERYAKLGAIFPRTANFVAGSRPAKYVMERFFGVDSRREIPEFSKETFVGWFDGRIGDKGDETVVVYPDLYTNYFSPERGKAAVRLLESLGYEVVISQPRESGRAPLSQGMVETSRRRAEKVADDLLSHIDEGRDVVVVEPSDLAMFRGDYEKLVPEEDYEHISENTYEIAEYAGDIADEENFKDSDAGDVLYHSHCQQRSLDLEEPTVSLLEKAGYDVTTTDAECCGMAGSFGYKSEYYEVSVDVGEQMMDGVNVDLEETAVTASGTSCADQFEYLTDGDDIPHPVELVADRVRERS